MSFASVSSCRRYKSVLFIVPMFESHRQIIDLWPVKAQLARELGVKYGVLKQWYHRGRIPADYWVKIVNAAHEIDQPVTYKLLAELIQKQ
jgi:hypothetical protein